MNINARLDHLLDRFKHDVRDFIDSAVASERASLMSKLEAFIDTDGKQNPDRVVVEEVKGYAKGGFVEGGAQIVVGDNSLVSVTVDKSTIDDLPKMPLARESPEPPIKVEFPVKERTCMVCGDSIEGSHKRRKICTKDSCRKKYLKDRAAKINEEQRKAIDARKADTSRPISELPSNEPPLSNRPLSEFVGTKKKRPFLCGFCGKPCDDVYCSNHCKNEDKRLSSLNKGKSYSDYLSEKGMKQPADIEL